MCIIKMVNDPYKNYSSIFNLVNYVLTDKRTGQLVNYYGGFNVNILRADEQMVLVKEYYHKTDSRKMRHFVVSFEEDVSPYDAYVLGLQIAAYYAGRYQIVFGVHEDTDNVHIHFVFNTVSFVDGLKYSGERSDISALKAYANRVYDEYLGGKSM